LTIFSFDDLLLSHIIYQKNYARSDTNDKKAAEKNAQADFTKADSTDYESKTICCGIWLTILATGLSAAAVVVGWFIITMIVNRVEQKYNAWSYDKPTACSAMCDAFNSFL